jgi:membrane protease YdiL (CAAX protease family)
VAEELFYWGYLFGALRQGLPFWAAAAITSAFFGARHAAHFLFLGPRRYPGPAAAWLAASTAITGLINSWLYERIGALSPLMAIHLAANLLFAAYAVAHRPAPGITASRP